jgi:hypothetical protein
MENYQDYTVKMVNVGEGKPTRSYKQTIVNFGSLGRELKVSPKSHITFNKAGYKHEFFVESVSILIGIGKDHTADIVMSKEAWEAFKSGEEISITTLKEFKERFL